VDADHVIPLSQGATDDLEKCYWSGTFRTSRGAREGPDGRIGVLAAIIPSERGTVISPDTVQAQIATQTAITAAK
jgi:hypothetical protein